MADKRDNVLEAENEAKIRILEVMQEKDDLLKQAKERAKKELKSHDDQLQQETQEKVTNLYVDRSEIDRIEENTEKEIAIIEQNFNRNKKEVVDYLFESVININIVIPDVVKADFEKSMK